MGAVDVTNSSTRALQSRSQTEIDPTTPSLLENNAQIVENNQARSKEDDDCLILILDSNDDRLHKTIVTSGCKLERASISVTIDTDKSKFVVERPDQASQCSNRSHRS